MAAGDIINVGVQNPGVMRRMLNDRNSMFFEHTGLAFDDPLVVALRAMAAEEPQLAPGHAELFNVRPISALGLTEAQIAQLHGLGRGNYDLFLTFEVPTREGTVWLSPDEFNMYRGSVRTRGPAGIDNFSGRIDPANADAGYEFADQWAERINLTIQSQAVRYELGNGRRQQIVYLENPVAEFNPYFEDDRANARGATRGVRQGRQLTGSYGATPPELGEYGALNQQFSYGYMELTDLDPDSPTRGSPLLVYDGQLDVFVSAETIRERRPMNGNVIIKERDEDGNSDPKVFDCDDPLEALISESVSWEGERRIYNNGDIPGIELPGPISLPVAFVDDLISSRTQYIELTGAQFAAWRMAMQESQHVREISLQRWAEESYGSLENFQRLFPGDGPISRDRFHSIPQTIRTGVIESGAVDENYIRSVQGALVTLGYLDAAAVNGDVQDGPTREAIARLQSENANIGSGGELTNGVVQLLNRRIDRYISVQEQAQATFAANAEAIAYVREHGNEEAVQRLVDALPGDVTPENLEAFLNDPDNALAIRNFRWQLEEVNRDNKDFNVVAPDVPVVFTAVRDEANEITFRR